MHSAMKMVEKFQRVFSIPISKKCRLPMSTPSDKEARELRMRLLHEEYMEYLAGEEAHDMEEIADGLADMVYIICGTALTYGIPLEQVFDVVHRSNMAKLGPEGKPLVRSDGKVTKPEGWKPPDIARVLKVFGCWEGK
ncbi:hypothetical protein LCGC14_0748660 [marine sediment metagenome]|uniref:NTP pyrophosphohydrolase MazG putative catalytic core domain-containing protein n=1 Tax=marine sediment metagenome TaxID=412755 RepID=A0A0F9Q4L5_9ZZZZ